MTTEFDQSTDFLVQELKIDGIDIRPMFFSLEVFENIYVSAVTGTAIVVDTSSNQLLYKKKLEGNEKFEFQVETPKGIVEFKGYLNRIVDKMVDGNGSTIYTLEFVSPVVRGNEMTYITRSFKGKKPKDVIETAIERMNENVDFPIKKDIMKGDGMPMAFLSSRWKPIKLSNFVQRKGVPFMKRPDTTSRGDSKEKVDNQSKGTAGFLFWQTLKGMRFGSDFEVLNGDVGMEVSDKFNYELANRGKSIEETSKAILDFDLVQNNDTETQTRSGSFKSVLISFDPDKLHYKEQTWESDYATDKQKDTSKQPTRFYNRFHCNERWENMPTKAQDLKYEHSRLYLQQGEGMSNNMNDGVSRFTLPVRSDINAGDKINTTVFEVNTDSATTYDKKFSGDWIISGVAHHFRLETKSAHTRITCIRATHQTDEHSSFSV